MRILLITSRYLPHRGGMETVVREISAHMRVAGHEVKIVTNRFPRALPASEVIDNAAVTRLTFLYPELESLRSRRPDLFAAGLVYLPLSLSKLYRLLQGFK